MSSGLCQCGCGQRTTIATRNYHDRGIKKGEPERFVKGHSSRRYQHVVDAASGCWIWQGPLSEKGYGGSAPHRRYYKSRFGPIPDGMEIDHLCRNRACVNPEHLEAVTHQENIYRSSRTKLDWETVNYIRASDEARDALAKRFGVVRGTIEQVIANNIWRDSNYVPPKRRGEIIRPKIAKLTRADALAIRSSTESSRALAARYGVTPSTINNVRWRRTFAYLP